VNQWHVATAAEAIAAAQFARCGWDVSVQYGANQPEYDIIAVRKPHILKVSVKGSQDGGWGLTQSYMKDRNYHRAIEVWLDRHASDTIMCFVQFQNSAIDEMPRVYLARPSEVASWLKAAAAGRGDTVLKEHHVWTDRAQAAGTTDSIPTSWKFSGERAASLASGTCDFK
jgi:Holliday junction resolvase-like predicted endonuclease